VDVAGIVASQNELLEVVARIKLLRSFNGRHLHLVQKWYPHLGPMGRSSLLILSELAFIPMRNCSPQVQLFSIRKWRCAHL
jgi:hypothetical protein